MKTLKKKEKEKCCFRIYMRSQNLKKKKKSELFVKKI